ncbi:phosphotransferase [Spirillospora sp. NPDC050679]
MSTLSPEDWAKERLRASGTEVTGPVERTGARAWSSQFRVPTASGHVYFKSSPPAFGHEAALTLALSEWFPGDVPEVVAADPERNWMLTADFATEGEFRDPGCVLREYPRMISVFTRIQVDSAPRVEELLATGCPDHRLEKLPDLYDELVSEPGDPQARGLTSDERRELRRLARDFRETCGLLAAHAVPETVVHADLWRGNFLVSAGRPLIFDWAESMVAHPFFSLMVVLQDVRALAPGDDRRPAQITDAYLRAWRHVAPESRLAEAARLAAAPALVSRALMWRNAIAGLDARHRSRYEGTVADQLRSLLRHPPEPVAGGR